MINAEISLGFAGTKPSTLLCGRQGKLLASGLGDLTDVSANFLYFNHQSLQKGSELCFGICRMQTSESKEKNGFAKGRVFSSRKLHAILVHIVLRPQGTGQSVGF